MKIRIISAVAALVSLCLLARLAPAFCGHRGQRGSGGPPQGQAKATVLRKLRGLRDEWVGLALTAPAVFRYLIEPEPPAASNDLVASNGATKTQIRPGMVMPPIPASAPSNFSVSFDGLVRTQFDKGNSFRSQTLVAPIAALPSGMKASAFHFELACRVLLADSRPANPIEEGRGDASGQSLRCNGSRSFIIIAIRNTAPANFRCASNLPAKYCQPVLTDSVERPG
jgi:hypothetical protein